MRYDVGFCESIWTDEESADIYEVEHNPDDPSAIVEWVLNNEVIAALHKRGHRVISSKWVQSLASDEGVAAMFCFDLKVESPDPADIDAYLNDFKGWYGEDAERFAFPSTSNAA